MEERMAEAVAGDSGYAAWEEICRAFYAYAIENPGVFSPMLWYNKYQAQETITAAGNVFSICSDITASLGISDENCHHLLCTFQAFLEGFCLLVNHNAFGHSLAAAGSFQLSLKVLITGMKELEGK